MIERGAALALVPAWLACAGGWALLAGGQLLAGWLVRQVLDDDGAGS